MKFLEAEMAKHDPTIYIFVGHEEENYDNLAENIKTIYDKNIISGRSEDLFAPNEVVLREEFVKMIVQAFGITQTKDAFDLYGGLEDALIEALLPVCDDYIKKATKK